MNQQTLAAFKAYDIRGKVPQDINEDIAYSVGRAYAAEIKPNGAVAVGRDVRETSSSLSQAVCRGLNDAGVDTVDIGLCGTEMVYFASTLKGMGGGIMVTASHNPKEYNGLKLVRHEGRPISADTGLMDIERRVRTNDIPGKAKIRGSSGKMDVTKDYIQRILSFVNRDVLKPFSIVANAGNGCVGPVLAEMAKFLPFTFMRLNFKPDGTFPSGVPNPLITEQRKTTVDAIHKFYTNIGIAWDGDFDRCFFFDETGVFIEGYYIVGLLAKRLLISHPGGAIVHDPRLTWNTLEIVTAEGGIPIISKSGHSFIKEKMRETHAVYGGEMSAHHYFRDFSYCDSGMIPWLLIVEEMSRTGLKLSDLVGERMKKFPCSGEINRTVHDPDSVVLKLSDHYRDTASSQSSLDGISMEFDNTWRFNLRKSNTEPVVRLNVESRGDEILMKEKTAEILGIIDS